MNFETINFDPIFDDFYDDDDFVVGIEV